MRSRLMLSKEAFAISIARRASWSSWMRPSAKRRDQGLDRGRRKEAGRAAPEENTVDAPPPHVGQRELEIGDQGLDVGPLRDVAPRLVGIEIAVRTLLHAPGNVNVEREGRENAKPDASGRGNTGGRGNTDVRGNTGGRDRKSGV